MRPTCSKRYILLRTMPVFLHFSHSSAMRPTTSCCLFLSVASLNILHDVAATSGLLLCLEYGRAFPSETSNTALENASFHCKNQKFTFRESLEAFKSVFSNYSIILHVQPFVQTSSVLPHSKRNIEASFNAAYSRHSLLCHCSSFNQSYHTLKHATRGKASCTNPVTHIYVSIPPSLLPSTSLFPPQNFKPLFSQFLIPITR